MCGSCRFAAYKSNSQCASWSIFGPKEGVFRTLRRVRLRRFCRGGNCGLQTFGQERSRKLKAAKKINHVSCRLPHFLAPGGPVVASSCFVAARNKHHVAKPVRISRSPSSYWVCLERHSQHGRVGNASTAGFTLTTSLELLRRARLTAASMTKRRPRDLSESNSDELSASYAVITTERSPSERLCAKEERHV